MKTLLPAALAAGFFVWFTGCASTGTTGSSSGTAAKAGNSPAPSDSSGPSNPPGSLWERLDAARTARKDRGGGEEFEHGAGAADLPSAVRGRYETWWRSFVKADPEWPAAKAAWRREPAPGPQLLAENLLRRHVQAYDAKDRTEFERTKREIVEIEAIATPLLVDGLALAAGDTLVRQHAAGLIGAIGPAAIPTIERAMVAASPKGRWELVRALARMNDEAATPSLIAALKGGGAFEARIEAIKGLAENGDPRGYPVVASCLEDADSSVRKFAARYLPTYGKGSAAPQLLAYMERCEKERDQDGVAEAHEALKKLTSLDSPPESGAWKSVLRGYRSEEGRTR